MESEKMKWGIKVTGYNINNLHIQNMWIDNTILIAKDLQHMLDIVVIESVNKRLANQENKNNVLKNIYFKKNEKNQNMILQLKEKC